MTTRWRGTNQDEPIASPEVGEACREAEVAASATLTEETRVWFEGVLAERSRQSAARDVDDEQVRTGALSGAALEAARARWASEDAAWRAATQEFDRRRAEWALMTGAARLRLQREAERLQRAAEGKAVRGPKTPGKGDPERS